MTVPEVRVVEANVVAFRRTWRGALSLAVVTPAVFLASIGLGLGSLVDDANRVDLGGVSYARFIAPGLVAATAMRIGSTEGGFGVLQGINWGRRYHAMLATPVGAGDIARGHLLWIGGRIAMTSAAIVAVVAAFGEVGSPLAVLAVPAAVLCGLSFTGPVSAYAAGLSTSHGLTGVERFVIMPLFLFSGTFFPVEQLPDALEPIARVVPLWHGVELCRDLMEGDVPLVATVVHVAYLSLWVAAGAALFTRRLTKRLVV